MALPYICQRPLSPTTAPHGRPRARKRAMESSRRALRRQLPHRIEGISRLNSVSIAKVVRSRESKVQELFGDGKTDAMRLDSLLPRVLARSSGPGEALVRALLIEMVCVCGTLCGRFSKAEIAERVSPGVQ